MQDKYHAPFAEGHFYHIFNRGNNKENIFFKQENYTYFLVKFDEYVSDFLEVYAFCLLTNHFHFLARVKENLAGFQNLQGLIAHKSQKKIRYARQVSRSLCRRTLLPYLQQRE